MQKQTEQTEIKEGEALTERKQKYKKERNTRAIHKVEGRMNKDTLTE